MNKLTMALALGAATALSIGGSLALPAPAEAAMPVFDVTNYSQNLLQAARALEQINNQVRSLQNEASMLQNMAKNLHRIDFPQLQQLKSAMGRIDQLMGQAQGIDFKFGQLDQRIKALFPGVEQVLTGDQGVAQGRARLDAAIAGYRRSMAVQAGVVGNIREDSGIISDLVGRSQGAEGALEVGQAANQLLALSIKQQFQLQQLMASEFREASLDRATRAQAEQDGRAATRRFLGTGKAYSRGN